ncbi:MAG: SDR family NAD(P)-dependent oxidoreductase, partial [Bacteroidota bacterium]
MNKARFTDQVAIVTGAGVGIGYEIALQLALEGAAVLVNDVDTGLAERLIAKDYIQHNPQIPTGRAGVLAAIAFLQKMPRK